MNLLTGLLALAAIAYVLFRRLAGEPLEGRRLVVLPLVLLVLGATQVDGMHVTPLDVTLLVVGGAVGVVLGVLRGLTVQVYAKNGHLWYRYRAITIVVWLASLLLRLGQIVAGHALGADTKVMSAALLPVLALSLLAEALVVGKRALATGVPFAPQGSRRVR